LQKRLR